MEYDRCLRSSEWRRGCRSRSQNFWREVFGRLLQFRAAKLSGLRREKHPRLTIQTVPANHSARSWRGARAFVRGFSRKRTAVIVDLIPTFPLRGFAESIARRR